MRKSNLATVAYLTLVFLSGAVVGGLAHRLYTMRSVSASTMPKTPEEFRRRYVEEMKSRLHLNVDQLSKLNAVLDETHQKFQDLRERNKPHYEAIQQEQKLIREQQKALHEDQVARIRAILSDQQRDEYGRMQAEREQRRKQMEERDRRPRP